jgi:hypothetical protein
MLFRSRFDLASDLLKLLHELADGNAGQDNAPTDNSTNFRTLRPDGLFNTGVCERYREVVMDNRNAGNFVSEDFLFVERVFQRRPCVLGHGKSPVNPPSSFALYRLPP